MKIEITSNWRDSSGNTKTEFISATSWPVAVDMSDDEWQKLVFHLRYAIHRAIQMEKQFDKTDIKALQ